MASCNDSVKMRRRLVERAVMFRSMKNQNLPLRLLLVASVALLSGCFGGPSRIAAPEWDVEAITAACMLQADADSDGFVTKAEAKENAPGLAYALPQLDADGDKQLSPDEIQQRFQDLKDAKTGVQGFNVRLSYKGRPLRQADIRLVPEPFLEGIVEPADGQIVDEYSGLADFDIPGDEFYGVRPGMYRIEVRSDDVKIASKYNDETTLGVEVIPFTNPNEAAGGINIQLK